MKRQGIYTITNTLTGKVYVGSSVDIVNRWRQHRRAFVRGDHPNPYFMKAWQEYGQDVFCFEQVASVLNKYDLAQVEQVFLDRFPEAMRYNLARTVDNAMLGRKHSATTRAILSQKAHERGYDRLRALASARVGKKQSAEHIAKKIASMTGLKRGPSSAETKRKQREAALKRTVPNPFAGKKHSDETRAKMRAYWAARRQEARQ